jgi:hypothetical protein
MHGARLDFLTDCVELLFDRFLCCSFRALWGFVVGGHGIYRKVSRVLNSS